jgi:hypothetical protein
MLRPCERSFSLKKTKACNFGYQCKSWFSSRCSKCDKMLASYRPLYQARLTLLGRKRKTLHDDAYVRKVISRHINSLQQHLPKGEVHIRPKTIFVCCSCGATVASREDFASPFHEAGKYIDHIHDSRLPGWLRNEYRRRYNRMDYSNFHLPKILSMRAHVGQACNCKLQPISACKTCSELQEYQELAPNLSSNLEPFQPDGCA